MILWLKNTTLHKLDLLKMSQQFRRGKGEEGAERERGQVNESEGGHIRLKDQVIYAEGGRHEGVGGGCGKRGDRRKNCFLN